MIYETIEHIKQDETYKQVLKDSFGGVMYDVANEGKYNTSTLEELCKLFTPGDRSALGGIMNGALDFLNI